MKIIKIKKIATIMALVLVPFVSVQAAKNTLQSVDFISLPQNKVLVKLALAEPLEKAPANFTTESPPRIALDFHGVGNEIDPEFVNLKNNPLVKDFAAAQVGDRTRVVLELSQAVNSQLSIEDNYLLIALESTAKTPKNHETFTAPQFSGKKNAHQIKKIVFRKSEQGTEQVVIDVSDPSIGINVDKNPDSLVMHFADTSFSKNLQRHLDVSHSGSLVKTIDVVKLNKDSKLQIKTKGNFEHIAYQVDNQFIIDFKPLAVSPAQAKESESNNGPSSDRLSLNFQDIKVRAVLQIIAESAGLNIVASDSVKGSITLRLTNVPWHEALDIVMRIKGLDKRQVGNVLLVAPSDEISAHEKAELEAKLAVSELSPLQTELFQVKYASAEDFATLLKEQGNSLLSIRGSVSTDERTNTLLLQDTAEQLTEIKSLLRRLDIPVRQVLIEARIVNIDRNFERSLGVRFGISKEEHFSGTLEGASKLAAGTDASAVPVTERLNFDLSAAKLADLSSPGSVALALARLGEGILLDLELSALESEGGGELVSSPRLVTANQKEAIIESGEEIPYEESTSSGATSISFKKAVLSLRVTPHITPDNRIVLKLKVNQDARGSAEFNGVPVIETRQIETQVLVDNGETIVLGGIFIRDQRDRVKRIPFLGKLPVVGSLFRNNFKLDNQKELLIFVTPKIVMQGQT